MSGRPLSLALYGATMAMLEPCAPLLLRARAQRGKEDPARLGERMGRARITRPGGPLVWLHGVSVGEATSLLPLVDALRQRRPDLAILVTSGTTTAAAMLAQRLPAGVIHQYVPIDGPSAVRRFLDHWQPGLAVFVESELWPNLILAAKARGVRLALLSARMTTVSARRWSRQPTAARALISAFDLIQSQDVETASRLQGFGAAPAPNLNLKLVGEVLPFDDAELARLATLTRGRNVVLAASTHPGEEALIANAVRGATPDALLIIAPRHPERGTQIAEMLGGSLRSQGGALTSPYIADTLGELGLFFRLADVVVMGGSFVPGIGGHNPMEPARIGKPILTGRYIVNAAELYDALLAEVAAIRANDDGALGRHIRGLLDNPIIARRISEAALAFAKRQGAALEETMAQLDPLIPS